MSSEYIVVSWHLVPCVRGTSDSPVKWSVQLHLISLAHFLFLSSHAVVWLNKFLSNDCKTLPKKREISTRWVLLLPEFPCSPAGKGWCQHIVGQAGAWLSRSGFSTACLTASCWKSDLLLRGIAPRAKKIYTRLLLFISCCLVAGEDFALAKLYLHWLKISKFNWIISSWAFLYCLGVLFSTLRVLRTPMWYISNWETYPHLSSSQMKNIESVLIYLITFRKSYVVEYSLCLKMTNLERGDE